MGKFTDLTGQKFGRLLVLRPGTFLLDVKSGHFQTVWVCKCECGIQKEFRAAALTRSKRPTRSCGCSRKGKRANNFKDLSGQRFERLLVIALGASRNSLGGQRTIYWKVRCDCGAEKEVRAASLKLGQIRSCGCLKQDLAKERKMEKAPGWKGGRTKSKDGYVFLFKPVFPGHENYKRTQIGEHIVVMARHLGRPLQKGETVHHKNGIRDDNRIENLQLMASNHGAGQRVEDLVVWAKEILSRYDASRITSPRCV